MLTLAVRLPLAVGAKVTEIVQLAPTARVLGLIGQVFVCPKSAAFVPAMPIELIVSAAVPVFVSVTLWGALEVPTGCWPKPRLVGDNVTAGAVATPVPLSVTVWGLPGALSATLRLAARDPAAVGVNVTEIVQLAPAASVLGHAFVCAKSPAFVPVIPIELIVIAADPVFVRVAVCGGLVVPTVREPKPRLPGLND